MNDDRLIVRNAIPEDEPFLFQLFNSCREHVFGSLDLPADQVNGLIEMQFRARNAHYLREYPSSKRFIVFLDSEPVGAYWTDEGEEMRLLDVAVRPEWRGKSLGTQILRSLMRDKPVLLEVERGNPAFRLYSRLGFKVIAEDQMNIAMRWDP